MLNSKKPYMSETSQKTGWGRTSSPSGASALTARILLFVCPIVCLFFANANINYNGSFWEMLNGFDIPTVHSIPNFSETAVVRWNVIYVLSGWLLFQWVLALLPDFCSKILPIYQGGIQRGQATPAGRILKYNINGLQAWIVTHLTFLIGTYWGYINPNWIVENWIALFWGANFFGYMLTIFAYVKAKFFPTHPEDNKESGDMWYDMVMGVEFNPRIFGVDMKLFFNGRPGIVGWTILNLSFAYYQYAHFGVVSNGMIMLNILQGVYVLDFFWNERWYLKTIDIAHDHFGFYLAFGDCVWLPWMYTLQGCYLAFHPVEHSWWMCLVIICLGLVGYTIFRWTNYQKDYFRRTITRLKERHWFDEKEKEDKITVKILRIWGEFPSFITCEYGTSDGKIRESHLLTSGWWGVARHMNYFGDIILSTMWGLCCGFTHILPHFYTFYIITLLITRVYRDETRCREKYGDGVWDEYCKTVKYRFIPYVY